MEQFDVHADKNRNRIYCILKGFFLESEIDLAFNRISDELNKLTDGFDVILDIQNLKTQPEFLQELFYERFKMMIDPDCRYIFKVTQDKIFKPVIETDRNIFANHNRIRLISHIQEAEDFLESDLLFKNIIYN
ncbi:MAG: hypothetical protein JW723_04185 [Bacteroidales bacterium]|nr:hypothetical protein [Bacteroidales bacterium]